MLRSVLAAGLRGGGAGTPSGASLLRPRRIFPHHLGGLHATVGLTLRGCASLRGSDAAVTADNNENDNDNDDNNDTDFVVPLPPAAAAPPVLGVQRDEAPPAEALSRLRVPLAQPDDASRSAPTTPAPTAAEAAELLAREAELTERGAQGAAAARPELALPFDDEQFAETLLQLEAEGVIDEAWQDTRRARMEDASEIVNVLRQMKVRDVAVIDTSAKTSSFDFMIFGTCEGARHTNLAAWAVQEADRHTGATKVKRRKADDQWEPLCIGRIVVNLMTAAYRDSVSFERKWAVTRNQDALAAALAPVSEGRQVRVHGLWTLTLNLQDLEDFEVDYCKEFLLEQR